MTILEFKLNIFHKYTFHSDQQILCAKLTLKFYQCVHALELPFVGFCMGRMLVRPVV